MTRLDKIHAEIRGRCPDVPSPVPIPRGIREWVEETFDKVFREDDDE